MEGDAELQDLYREVLLDYSRSASRKGKIDPADVRAHGINPVCGDELEITARREDGRLSQVRYAGHGCVISQASAAMMAEALEGSSVERARELVGAFKRMMLDNAPAESLPEELEPLSALEGVRKFPLRVKCATLGWNTILQGLDAVPGVSFRQIGAALQPVYDPEIRISIVDLGLIYGAEIASTGKGLCVRVKMSLTSPACPYGPMLLASVHSALARIPGVKDVDVDLVFSPTWDPRAMATEEAKEQLGLF